MLRSMPVPRSWRTIRWWRTGTSWTGRSRPTSPTPAGFDAVVFAVPHDEYRRIDLASWLGDARPAIFDGFACCRPTNVGWWPASDAVASIGRGGEDLSTRRAIASRTW